MPPPPHNSRKRSARGDAAPAPAAGPQDPAIANLEMEGERLKVYSLSELLRHKRGRPRKAETSLADVLLPWFEKSVEQPSAKLAGCVELWTSLVPKQLVERTRLVAFQRGTLTVSADNTTVRAELDAALRRGVLRQLQTASKGVIFRIKTCVQPSGIPEIS